MRSGELGDLPVVHLTLDSRGIKRLDSMASDIKYKKVL